MRLKKSFPNPNLKSSKIKITNTPIKDNRIGLFNDLLISNEFKIYDHRKKTGILEQIEQYLKRDNLDVAIWAKQASTKERHVIISSVLIGIVTAIFYYSWSFIEFSTASFKNVDPNKSKSVLVNTNFSATNPK